MLTRNGIAYDLTKSPYQVVVTYGKDDSIIYTFSSEYYKQNFMKKLEDNRELINNSLSKRFGFRIVNNKIGDLKLYKSIEKRGFLIETEDSKVECLSNITLDGLRLTSVS